MTHPPAPPLLHTHQYAPLQIFPSTNGFVHIIPTTASTAVTPAAPPQAIPIIFDPAAVNPVFISTAAPTAAATAFFPLQTFLPPTAVPAAASATPAIPITVVAASPVRVTPAPAVAVPMVSEVPADVKSNPLASDLGREQGSVSADLKQQQKKKKKRQRSAFLSELKFKGYLDVSSNGPNSRIRVWVNDKDMHYYDCACGKRKAVQDLYKIKQHIKRHEISQHTCRVCGRMFSHHLQINAHMKVHKKIDEDQDGDVAMPEAHEVHHHHPHHHNVGCSSSSSSSGSTPSSGTSNISQKPSDSGTQESHGLVASGQV